MDRSESTWTRLVGGLSHAHNAGLFSEQPRGQSCESNNLDSKWIFKAWLTSRHAKFHVFQHRRRWPPPRRVGQFFKLISPFPTANLHPPGGSGTMGELRN